MESKCIPDRKEKDKKKCLSAFTGLVTLKVIVGTVILATAIAFDGDGTSTVIILFCAMLPLYKRLGISPIILVALGTMPLGILNLVPWRGPSARVMAALKLEANDLFVPLIPALACALIFVVIIAYFVGKRERVRLGITHVDDKTLAEIVSSIVEKDMELKRPKMFWFNLILTLLIVVTLLKGVLPVQIVFAIGFAIALIVNYPQVKIQKHRIEAMAADAFKLVLMIARAGIFTGIITGTKMSDAMAQSIIAVIPDSLGPHLAVFTALLSPPGTFFLSNDAFYLGILPIIAKTAAIYGITPQQIGLASLLGQPFHGLSPLLPAAYLACGLADVNFVDFQKLAAKYCLGILVVTILVAGFTGAIPF